MLIFSGVSCFHLRYSLFPFPLPYSHFPLPYTHFPFPLDLCFQFLGVGSAERVVQVLQIQRLIHGDDDEEVGRANRVDPLQQQNLPRRRHRLGQDALAHFQKRRARRPGDYIRRLLLQDLWKRDKGQGKECVI